MKTLLGLSMFFLVCNMVLAAGHKAGGFVLFKATEKQFRLGPPEGVGGGLFVLDEINSLIPKAEAKEYDYLHDYTRDVSRVFNVAKAAGESVVGLERFFGDILPNDKHFNVAMFKPRLILRCRDKNNAKIWVVFMNWEFYRLPSVTKSKKMVFEADHVATYVIDYTTGEVIYDERC